MSWNIRDNKEQEHLEFITSEFVPMLMRHGAISDAWLNIAGSNPEMIMGIVSEDDIELRALTQSAEWQAIQARLNAYVEHFRVWYTTKIQHPGGFQM